jgi:membrane protein
VTSWSLVHLVLVVLHVDGMAGGPVLAAGLATKAMLALLPGLLLVVSFIGFIVSDPAVQARVIEGLAELFPPLADLLEDTLGVIASGAVPFTIIALIGLAWGASGVFQTLEVACAVIFGEERRRDPFARGAIGLVGVALVLAVVGAAIVAAVVASDLLARLFGDGFSGELRQPAAVVVAGAVFGGGLALVYRYLPRSRPGWSLVLVPAAVMGLGFGLLTQLFTLLVPLLAGTASLYGALTAVFALLIWLEFSARLAVTGISWVRVRALGEPPRSTMGWPTGDRDRPRTASAGASAGEGAASGAA